MTSYQYYETDPLVIPATGYAGPRKSKTKKTCLIVVASIAGVVAAIAVILSIYYLYDFDAHVQYRFKNAAVASDAKPCSEIGRNILLYNNGNAVDAAIATLLCINLFNPQSAGIGGGHFLMYYDKETQSAEYYDAREVAPLQATEDMYEDDHNASDTGALSIAVPGEISGYWQAHQEHGRVPWKDLFTPTIEKAQQGFEVSKEMARVLLKYEDAIRTEPSLSEIFFNSDGEPLKEGDVMYRPILAKTLQTIAEFGESIFYEGDLAEDIVNDIQERGGIITLDDLRSYKVQKREPLVFRLADLNLYIPPPPGSGAVLALILNILEGYDIKKVDFENNQLAIDLYHHVVEAIKFGYAQRTFLGDPEFVNVTEQVADMTSKEYASTIRSLIQDCCTHEPEYYFFDSEMFSTRDDHGTSHLSIIDQDGNAVSVTSTINGVFGSSIRGNRTGIIFNDEMDDFSMPYDTNIYNIPPPPENFIEAGKRPLSSMVPTIGIDDKGDVRLVIGAAGGKRITTAVAQAMMNTLWGLDNMKDGIERLRVHNSLLPSSNTEYEKGFRQIIVQGLKDKGNNITEATQDANVQGIKRTDSGLLDAACDSRKGGVPAGF